MNEITNQHVKAIWNSQKVFLENINGLYDSFEYSDNTLRNQKIEAQREYNNFLKKNKIKIQEDGARPIIPVGMERQYLRVERKLHRSQESSKLLLRSYIVSMVSQFDAYIAALLRNIYAINPDKLKQSGHTLTFEELQTFSSIDAAREHIIESKIENILRDSHQEQISEIASSIGVKSLKEFPNWPIFVEITQRRNLFVHSNGIVSGQYLNICKEEGVKFDNLKKGDQLEVDRDYFIKAFNVFYEVAVKLSQMALRVLLLKKDKSALADIDKCIITNIFDLIVDKRYEVAIELSDFALDAQFKHSDKDRIYLTLNRAQAFKWKGDETRCQQLLSDEDTSAWSSELKCPKYALEGNLDKVCELMISIGANGEILHAEEYRNWPIFQAVRSEDKFRETFKTVFGEDLDNELKESSASQSVKAKVRIRKGRKEVTKESKEAEDEV